MANPHVGVNMADMEATLNRYNACKTEIETAMRSIAAVAGGLESMEQNSEVQKLEEALATCARAMQSVKNEATALKEAKAMLPQLLAEGFNEVEWYKKRFAELQAESERTGVWRKQDVYRQLRLRLWRINHHGESLPEEDENDEELLVVRTQEDNFICPITKLDFVNPFKNPACGHTYSRDAIMEFINKKRAGGRGQVKCPVAACSAFVQPNEIVPDKDTERRMRDSKRRKKRPTQEQEAEEVLDL